MKEPKRPYAGNRGDQMEAWSGLIETVHGGVAMALGPEWECTREEANKIARAAVRLSELYAVDMTRFAKPLAWGQLARAIMDVEKPRLQHYMNKPRGKRGPRTERAADGTVIIDAEPARPEVYIPD